MSALILPFGDASPTIDLSAWLAPTATVIGQATIAADASVFFGAVVRADMDRIELGTGVSVGSNTTVLYDTKIGDYAQLGPLTIVMRGESIPGHSEWGGAPAVPVLHEPAPMKLAA